MILSFHHRLFVHAMILGMMQVTRCLTASTFKARITVAEICKQGYTDAALLLLLRKRHRQRFLSTLSSSVLEPNQAGPRRINEDHKEEKQEPTWLVVGDGDLSYSASIASSLNERRIKLLASVLEDQEKHEQIYRNSKKHSKTISSFERHRVLYGVDATALAQHFPRTTNNSSMPPSLFLERVIFNFPHWKGKSNHRYNQQLVNDFFQSVVNVINANGQVHVALVAGQGGMEATDIQEWKQSWQVPVHANNHGLLLRYVQPFYVDYDLSSHRGVDRAFSTTTGGSDGSEQQGPFRYIFGLAAKRNVEASVVDERFQIACRHELRIRLNADGTTATGVVNVSSNNTTQTAVFSRDELLNVISALARRVAPVGIRVEIPWNEIITTSKQQQQQSSLAPTSPLLVFLVVYAGQSTPLCRATANEIRSRLEMAVQQELGLEIAKPGRMVSKPFPFALLETLRKENADMGEGEC